LFDHALYCAMLSEDTCLAGIAHLHEEHSPVYVLLTYNIRTNTVACDETISAFPRFVASSVPGQRLTYVRDGETVRFCNDAEQQAIQLALCAFIDTQVVCPPSAQRVDTATAATSDESPPRRVTRSQDAPRMRSDTTARSSPAALPKPKCRAGPRRTPKRTRTSGDSAADISTSVATSTTGTNSNGGGSISDSEHDNSPVRAPPRRRDNEHHEAPATTAPAAASAAASAAPPPSSGDVSAKLAALTAEVELLRQQHDNRSDAAAPVHQHQHRQHRQPHRTATRHAGRTLVPLGAVRAVASQQQLWHLEAELAKTQDKWADAAYEANAVDISDDDGDSSCNA
jgi:hypothetical protein